MIFFSLKINKQIKGLPLKVSVLLTVLAQAIFYDFCNDYYKLSILIIHFFMFQWLRFFILKSYNVLQDMI